MVPPLKLAPWLRDAGTAQTVIAGDHAMRAELRVTDSGPLELTLRRLSALSDFSGDQVERVSGGVAGLVTGLAADWCYRASWQVRGLVERGRVAKVGVPIGDEDAPGPVGGLSELPSLGWLIRPLFLEFEPTVALRQFQVDGVAWLLEHPKAILADDMGLGKTLQVLEGIRTQIYRGAIQNALVLCPRTLAFNWLSECEKWAPELVVASSVNWRESPESMWSLVNDRRVHVAIIHYDQLRSIPKEVLSSTDVQLLVMDEAHRVRRSEAAITSAVRSIRAASTWALSGTPIERDAEDLATILSIIAREKYSASVASRGHDAVRSIAEPLLLRRRKSDVLSDLPPVDEQTHYVDLSRQQRQAYDNALVGARSKPESKGHLLKMLGELLNICDMDPATGSSSKLEEIVAQLQKVSVLGEKAVVFSYKLKPLDQLEVLLTEAGVEWVRLDGQMDADERNDAVIEFRTRASAVALLASSRVASEGLTLTEANHAFFVNRWWNPSNSDQARDRIVRIGQSRPVEIHYYICRNTVEERLEQILLSKRDLIDRVVDSLATGRDALISEVDIDELLA
jgi:SNF2 family DNA or RNA helicase